MGRVVRINVAINSEQGLMAFKDFSVQPFERVIVKKGEVFGVRVEIGSWGEDSVGDRTWEGGPPIECDSVEVVFDDET